MTSSSLPYTHTYFSLPVAVHVLKSVCNVMFVNALSYVCIIFVITIVTCKISNISIIFLLSCKLSLNLRRLMRSEATLSLTLENVIVRGSFARIFAGFIALKICLALYSEILLSREKKIFNFFSSLSLSLIFLIWVDLIRLKVKN